MSVCLSPLPSLSVSLCFPQTLSLFLRTISDIAGPQTSVLSHLIKSNGLKILFGLLRLIHSCRQEQQRDRDWAGGK